jgi:hypothetical protein
MKPPLEEIMIGVFELQSSDHNHFTTLRIFFENAYLSSGGPSTASFSYGTILRG